MPLLPTMAREAFLLLTFSNRDIMFKDIKNDNKMYSISQLMNTLSVLISADWDIKKVNIREVASDFAASFNNFD